MLSPFIILIVIAGCYCLSMIIRAMVTGVRDIAKHRNETELKQTMVDRGMSADEIESVCQASAARPNFKC